MVLSVQSGHRWLRHARQTRNKRATATSGWSTFEYSGALIFALKATKDVWFGITAERYVRRGPLKESLFFLRIWRTVIWNGHVAWSFERRRTHEHSICLPLSCVCCVFLYRSCVSRSFFQNATTIQTSPNDDFNAVSFARLPLPMSSSFCSLPLWCQNFKKETGWKNEFFFSFLGHTLPPIE